MKTIFIPVKYTGKVELDKIKVDKLPKKLGLVTTVQFLDNINEIKKYLENFPFIDFWVNTACPRIADDEDKKNVIGMGELDLSV